MAIPPGGFAASKKSAPSYAAEVASAATPAKPAAAAAKASPAVAAVTDGTVVNDRRSESTFVQGLIGEDAGAGEPSQALSRESGVSHLIAVTQLKAGDANDAALAGADAQSDLISQQKSLRGQERTIAEKSAAKAPASVAAGYDAKAIATPAATDGASASTSLSRAAQKDGALVPPPLRDSAQGSPFADLRAETVTAIARLPLSKLPAWRLLETGAGDDRVEISRSDDQRIHVAVNGEEVWAGTQEQFENLYINTGAGNDTVINRVEGANIDTGSGNDRVKNYASRAEIDAGDGNDLIQNYASKARINAGSGNDLVVSRGNDNEVEAGSGDDVVSSRGDRNTINTAAGRDVVDTRGDLNNVQTGSGDDKITSHGNDNTLDTGRTGADALEIVGDRNIAPVDETDQVKVEGQANALIPRGHLDAMRDIGRILGGL